MGTAALILIALLIELQARRLPVAGGVRAVYVVGLQPLLICFAIVMLISGLGGPTACAFFGLVWLAYCCLACC
jgi:hypothetical protein